MEINIEEIYQKLQQDDLFVAFTKEIVLGLHEQGNGVQIDETLFQIRTSLSKESDRGMVLLATSYLENILGEYIYSYLQGSKRFRKSMFKTTLSSFASKINFAFAVGLINDNFFYDLNNMRMLRNKFAHSYTLLDFESEQIDEIITSFKYKFIISETPTNRQLFMTQMYVISAVLLPCSKTSNSLRRPKDLHQYFISLPRSVNEYIVGVVEEEE